MKKFFKKTIIIACVMMLCLISLVYAANENYTSTVSISSNSSLEGSPRSYSDNYIYLKLSEVDRENTYDIHKCYIEIRNHNNLVGSITYCYTTINVPVDNGTSTYKIGNAGSGSRAFYMQTWTGAPRVHWDGFDAKSVMWSQSN